MMWPILPENLCIDRLASILVAVGSVLATVLVAGLLLVRVDTTGSMGFRWYLCWWQEPAVNVVVEFTLPETAARAGYRAGFLHAPDSMLLKRVVGMPGDHVRVTAEAVHINGTRLPGAALVPGVARLGVAAYTIAPGHYFVLGDWRENSWDSRYFGPVQVQGTLVPLPF